MAGGMMLLQAVADTAGAYRDFPLIGSRAAIWIAAEIHLMFAAFVLGVPIFAVVAEAIGIFGKDQRYDRLAKEFTRLLLIAYSATAIWGAVFVFLLSTLYPRFWAYMTAIFGPSMWVYVSIFFFESFTLYLYYYGWDRWKYGRAKIVHWCLGILLNIWGTIVMFIADSWLTYMMTPPRDITAETSPTSIKIWHAILNHTWMPINIHRLIGNIVFGGAIVGAYASYRFLAARTEEERAHYDWMGYVGNFIAMSALIVLPFAGYWLGREIYQYDQSMGITMMGGFMSWLWVIQAFLIAVLFLTGNYYLWIGMERIPGAERFRPYTKWLLIVLVLGAIVWGTPHTMIADSQELAAMGGSHHLPLFPHVPARQHAARRAVGAHRHPDPGSDVRGGRGRGAVLRHPRLLRRGDRADRVQRVPGARRARLHPVRDRDRHLDGARGAVARGDSVGQDAAPFAVCALHPGGHVHVADGPDGVRALGDPAVLARLAGDTGHEQVRRHAGARLRVQDDQPVRAHLPVPRVLRVLAGRASGEVDLRGAERAGGRRCGPLTRRSSGSCSGRWRSIR